MDVETTTGHRPTGPAARARVPVRRWVGLCAAAEAVGMAAAAGAATIADRMTAPGEGAPAAAWGTVVLGGVVEGVAMGLAQSTALRATVPGLHRTRWVVTTVLVAGLGWGVVSGQAMLAADDGAGATPPWPVVVAGAGALGLVMGAVLGAAQTWALRGAVARAWPWVLVSAAAWCPAMVVIFTGASATPAGLPAAAVVTIGAATGVAAGATLGAGCAVGTGAAAGRILRR